MIPTEHYNALREATDDQVFRILEHNRARASRDWRDGRRGEARRWYAYVHTCQGILDERHYGPLLAETQPPQRPPRDPKVFQGNPHMKAAFGVEAVGIGYELKARGVVVHVEKPWLAEIAGRDIFFVFDRQFLRPKIDKRKANRAGTRGVWWWWTLEPGQLYEANYRRRETGHHRHFLMAVDGDIMRLTREEAEQWLNRDSGSTS